MQNSNIKLLRKFIYQIIPTTPGNKMENYTIKNKEDLLKTIISLRDETALYISEGPNESGFYKDYNALNLVIWIIESMEEF